MTPIRVASSLISYHPPSPDVLEHFAFSVCNELGEDYNDPDVARSFASFLHTVAQICANNLNRKHHSDLEGCNE